VIATLAANLDTLVMGDPSFPATDIGPVIDSEAHQALLAHVDRLNTHAKIIKQTTVGSLSDQGHFFGPVIAEIPHSAFLEKEVFGPVLHICRYDPNDLDAVAAALAARGYGLTLGIHSRLESFAAQVMALVPAGNVYVNRSMIGAVVGVQPFGGEGLSGTGPKAGGPHALFAYASERAVSVNITAQGGDPSLLNL
jgi:RHH-type transcriptional regulator, proline utilization regulon repressor / proline dehydrogenase / delta 1-pyrroline-5-carboxylate dehydrogenase